MAAKGADTILILSEWNEFHGLQLAPLAEAMRRPAMADFHNTYSSEVAQAARFASYVSVGQHNLIVPGDA